MASLLARLAHRYACIEGLDTWARLTLITPEGRRGVSAALRIRRPDRIRIEVLDPLGRRMALVEAAEGRLHIEGRRLPAWLGDLPGGTRSPSWEDLATRLGLPASLEEVVETWVAGIPPPTWRQDPRLVAGMRKGILHLQRSADGSWWEIELEPTSLAVRARHRGLTSSSKSTFVVRYGDMTQLSGVPFPRRITWTRSESSLRLEARLRQPRLMLSPACRPSGAS